MLFPSPGRAANSSFAGTKTPLRAFRNGAGEQAAARMGGALGLLQGTPAPLSLRDAEGEASEECERAGAGGRRPGGPGVEREKIDI